MTAKTAELLCDPYPKCHIVFPYTNETAVAEAAGMFAAGGLARGEAVVLIASRNHRAAITARLASEAFDVKQLDAHGRLALFDSKAMLSKLLVDGMPEESRFDHTVGGIIETARKAAPNGKVRVFGEILSLLCGRDAIAAARLEELLNAAIETYSVPLLCTHALDYPERKLHKLAGSLAA